jgi:type IV pilus assembly protein PilB
MIDPAQLSASPTDPADTTLSSGVSVDPVFQPPAESKNIGVVPVPLISVNSADSTTKIVSPTVAPPESDFAAEPVVNLGPSASPSLATAPAPIAEPSPFPAIQESPSGIEGIESSIFPALDQMAGTLPADQTSIPSPVTGVGSDSFITPLIAQPQPEAGGVTSVPPISPVIGPANDSITDMPVVAPSQATVASPSPTVSPSASSDGITPPPTPNSLVGILLEERALTQQQLDELKLEEANTGKTIDALIEEKKLVSEIVLTKAKAKLFSIPFVELNDIGVSPEAISQIPESVARRYGMLPFMVNKQERTLSVAMSNPLDLSAIDFAEKKTGYHILPYFATTSEIERTIGERYAQNLTSEVNAALKETKLVTTTRNLDNLAVLSKEVVREAPITKIVETILGYAVKSRASDIHVEPQEDRTRVRYRIDGILSEKLILPRSVHEAVLSRIKILADLKIDEKRLPQDGRFTFTADSDEVDLRVSTLPTVHGEKVVLRLLQKNASVPSLAELGLRGQALRDMEESIRIPHGIVLITGPTGSGKTTTLYSILHKINTPKVNISTLEDPVEYQVPGVNQVQINPQAGLTFASGLRSFLRQDPNVIMVGEVRDKETAELAVQASLTGHLVFSTLHTNSAAGAIPRLLDMDVEPFLLASSLTLVVGQRVVRKINPEYTEEYTPEPVVVADIKKVLGPLFSLWCTQQKKDPEKITLFRPKAERPETEPEYKGRMAIFEVMRINEEINRLVLENKTAAEIEQVALKNGMMLMKQDGYIKALEGSTTIEEVLRVADV